MSRTVMGLSYYDALPFPPLLALRPQSHAQLCMRRRLLNHQALPPCRRRTVCSNGLLPSLFVAMLEASRPASLSSSSSSLCAARTSVFLADTSWWAGNSQLFSTNFVLNVFIPDLFSMLFHAMLFWMQVCTGSCVANVDVYIVLFV